MQTFHESYGYLDKRTLTLIRKYNVSPSDYDTILLFVPDASQKFIQDHIIELSLYNGGMYRLPFDYFTKD